MDATKEMADAVFYAATSMANAEQRQRFLDQTCQHDEVLRLAVEKLLSVQNEADHFFSKSRSALCLPPEEVRAAALSAGGNSPMEDAEVGTQVGCYKLLQRIGEGGCGVVYMAEQEMPVRRRVALKVIKLGMDTKNVIARFDAERQALAMMDHPNIAHVLDAGTTQTGRPYFAMELVRGVKITEYCDQNHLDTRERLRLFIQICNAVQHAHQKGVIHRDLKPSNILVTMHDGIPAPKVIDFGIAKAVAGQLTDQTMFTAYEQVVGTPAYMSPEQAEMSGLDVDTRSDIYSLGVLLYELLTGRTPFDGKELVRSGLEAMRRILREQEPAPPSLMLTTLQGAELQTMADHRRAEPPRLILTLKGDLDWIVMKALEKDRTRRYETANSLLSDVERYLNDEPVMARPPSRRYRLQKLVWRNKAAFLSGLAVALALIIGMGTSTWLFIKEKAAHQEQVRLREEAEQANRREAALLQKAEDRERITQAAILVTRGQIESADQLLDSVKTPPPRQSFDGVAAYRKVANWLAVQDRWPQAANRFSQLMDIDQLDDWSVVTLDYQGCGTALAENGDRERYACFCKASISRFVGTTNGNAAWRILRSTLLMPADKELLESLSPLATISEQSLQALGEQNNSIAWGYVSISLWKYREGEYQAALQWGRRALTLEPRSAFRSIVIHMILAMSYSQLNQPEAAAAELGEGRDLLENKLKTDLDYRDLKRGNWWDLGFARVLMREADSMIVAKPWPMPYGDGQDDSN